MLLGNAKPGVRHPFDLSNHRSPVDNPPHSFIYLHGPLSAYYLSLQAFPLFFPFVQE